MKICFVNILYSKPQASGGLGTHISGLSSALARRGNEVTVITSGLSQAYNRDGVQIVPISEVGRYFQSRQLWNPMYLLRRLVYMLRMTRYTLDRDFDVVEFADGGLEQLFLAFHRNCTLVTKLHGNFRFAFSHGRTLEDWVERIEGAVVSRSDQIYASTVTYSEQISKAYGIPIEKIAIIPCGIDVARIRSFQPEDLTERYSQIRGKRLVLLTVGSSPHRKGAPVFLQAAKHFQQSDILFVLSCDDAQFLAEADVPENVLLLSKLDQAQFYSWICASEIVVFPSTAESFSIAMHEAMLFGKIVVTSPFVPFEGIDTEYPRSLHLPKLDADSLVNAISEIVRDPGSFSEASCELHQRLSNYYDIERVAAVTEKLYSQARARSGTDQRPARRLR
jgi:glycosyltransferase involved in cell wall biosynthesis